MILLQQAIERNPDRELPQPRDRFELQDRRDEAIRTTSARSRSDGVASCSSISR
ncbi:MAG: hypothetical protein R3B99_07045 [Polyangiales bacterium]